MYTMSQNSLKIILTLIFLIFLVSLPEKLLAISSQLCSNCHTMHASYFEGPTHKVISPKNILLKVDCIGCHSGTTGSINSFGAPIVYHNTNPSGTGPGKTLAGGDFYWVAQGNYTNGHNVVEIIASGAVTPPGWDPTATSGLAYGSVAGGSSSWSKQLSCAGTYGCHGYHNNNDSLLALKGSHHKNYNGSSTKADSTTIGQHPVGGAYRFLAGIYGLEAGDWEWNATSTNHNEYYGVNVNNNYSNKNTISYLCAQCHGKFHSQIDDGTAGSPWLRHPVDIVLPNSGDYASYTTYNLSAPVARGAVPATSSSTVQPGNAGTTGAIVMCLSCHRAHGSENAYILRWNYQGWPANGQTIGCSVCHTSKY